MSDAPPTEQELANAESLFPNMPHEVVAEWLVDPMRAHGWPPKGAAWEGALRDRDVEGWAGLEWKKKAFLPEFSDLTDDSQNIIQQLVDGYFRGQLTEVVLYMGTEGRRKLEEILAYVGENQRLPSKLVMLEAGGEYEIVDGSHRLAVHFHALWTNGTSLLRSPPEVWVGRLGSGSQ